MNKYLIRKLIIDILRHLVNANCIKKLFIFTIRIKEKKISFYCKIKIKIKMQHKTLIKNYIPKR